MKEITISQLREKINNKLNSARLQVQKLEEQLQFFESLIKEVEDVPLKETISSEKK